ncbi:MAG TPA: branched-chain amino acid transaminase [Longimicrobiales bacterium]|nr:branched-chain amino acid transaminase [Longimicrobiales bacterium]
MSTTSTDAAGPPAFPRTDWIWKNGELVPWEDATLHVMSHVVHYGSSVFEGIRCYATPDGPAVFRLRDHMRRFHDSARICRMELAPSVEALEEATLELLHRNGLEEGYIRPIALRGLGAAGVSPAASPVDVYLVCWPWGAYLGDGALEAGVDVGVSSWNRPAPNTLPTLAKVGGGYVNSQLIKMEAVANGFAEGIALGPDGLVSEGSGQNVFLVRDGVLLTPGRDGTILPGITRDSILTIAEDLGIPVRETTVPRELLYCADEVFFTGTAAEVTPVRSVDRIIVGEGKAGPVTRRLQAGLLGIARGQEPDTHGWLTHVRANEQQEVVA